jgi:para-nitrobenzyl esterase
LAAPATVVIDSGGLAGAVSGGVVSYKGVPFAAPPVGELRWASPRDPPAWRQPREASVYGPACPQPMNADGSPNLGGASGVTSEDCLYLNVWAPVGARTAPVMVWLHGGGNTEGAGSLGAYDGSAFARDGVTLVTLNYRLGALGFFAHPALTRAAGRDEPLVGYGILDQIAALKWVKRNIAAFGGDPDNVTLFGESAGGIDTLVLMASPLARGLFAKAIVESGAGWAPPKTLAKAEAQGQALALKAGAPANATVEQLRALPVMAFTKADEREDFAPAVDGRLLTRSVSQTFAAGAAAPVPLVIGTNSYEASLMDSLKLPPAAVLAFAPASVKAAYGDEPDDASRAAEIFTDGFMGAPARWIAGRASAGPSYLYHFAYVPDSRRGHVRGAGHDTEIPFVFDSWSTLGVLGAGLSPSDQDRRITALVHGCWVAFAKTSRPACPGAPAWPAYDSVSDSLLEIDSQTAVRSHFRKARYDAQEAATLPGLQLDR